MPTKPNRPTTDMRDDIVPPPAFDNGQPPPESTADSRRIEPRSDRRSDDRNGEDPDAVLDAAVIIAIGIGIIVGLTIRRSRDQC